jgi:hypothetical protein
MKTLLFRNWNFFRILRLVLGIIIIVQAFVVKDVMFGIAGLLFSLMAIFNTACCGVGGCNVVSPRNKIQQSTDTSFEEVK